MRIKRLCEWLSCSLRTEFVALLSDATTQTAHMLSRGGLRA
jgi:hypothetical protein